MATLLSWLKGGFAQANPFDGGADFNSVMEEERRRRPAPRPVHQPSRPIVQQQGLGAPSSLAPRVPTPQPQAPRAPRVQDKPGFIDYLNPFGEHGLFGVEQQKNFQKATNPLVNKLESIQQKIDSTDKQEGFQWSDPADYVRFGGKLLPGMVQGAVEAPSAIARGVSGVDEKANRLGGLQRAGNLADGTISTVGVGMGGSGKFLGALLPGANRALAPGLRGLVELGKSASKEGAEEVVQTFAQDMADDGRVNTPLQDYAAAAGFGALGGGMMHGAGQYVNSVVRNANNAVDPAIRNTPQGRAMVANEIARQLVPGGTIAGRNAAGFADAQRQGLVFDGVDGKQRFEVDDSGAKLKFTQTGKGDTDIRNKFLASAVRPDGSRGQLPLSEVLDHPKLFEQYPELKNLPVVLNEKSSQYGERAFYSPKGDYISINSGEFGEYNPTLDGTLLHEIQHAIQQREGFARGGSLDNIRSKKLSEIYRKQAEVDSQLKELNPVGKPVQIIRPGEKNPMDTLWKKKESLAKQAERVLSGKDDSKFVKEYRNLAGEAEARAVQARMDMPMGERYVKAEPIGKDEVVLYHRTSKDSADKIRKSGKLLSKENTNEVFLSTVKDGQNSGYGDTIVPIRVKKSDIRLDDEFPSGEQHYAVKADKARVYDDSLKNTFDDSLDVPKEDLIIRNDTDKANFVERGRTPKRIHPDDQTVMARLIDHADGFRKLTPEAAHELEIDAARVAERYGIDVKWSKNKTPLKSLADAFRKRLDSQRYEGVMMSIDSDSNIQPFEADYINEQVASHKSAKEFRNSIVERIWQNNKGGKGVDKWLIPDDVGGGYKGRGQVSNNPLFFQDFKKVYGHYPAKHEIQKLVDQELAGEQTILSGTEEMFPLDRDIFNQLQEREGAMESLSASDASVSGQQQSQTADRPASVKSPRPESQTTKTAKTAPSSQKTSTLVKNVKQGNSRQSRQTQPQTEIAKTGETRLGLPYPDNTTDVKKRRGFAQSVKDSDEVSGAVRRKVNGKYNVRNTASMALAADDFSKGNLSKVTKDVNERLAVKTGSIVDQDIADAIAVAKRHDAKGNFDEAQQIYDKLAEHGTKGGQAIQAFSLLSNRTPEGVKFQMLRKLKEAGVKLNSNEQAEVGKLIDNVRKTKVGTEARNRALFNTLDYVSKKMPTKTGDKLINLWRAGLLTAPKTTGGNILGNATEAVTRDAWVNPIAVGADRVFSAFTGKRTKVITGGRIEGAKEGMKRGADYMKTGFDTRNINEKYDAPRRVNYKNKAIDKYVNGVYRWMGAQDQPFYYAAKSAAAHDLAKADGMNQGLKGEKLAEYVENSVQDPNWKPQTFKTAKSIDDYARYSVYQNDTVLAGMAAGLKQAADRKGARWVADFIMPFTQVPSSVAMRVVDRTPVGIAREIVSQVRRKEFDQRAMAEAIGNGTFAVPIVAAGYALAQAGEITGDYPDDDKERKLWQKEGKQPYSVKIGERWYSMNYMQPFGTLLNAGKQLKDDIADGKGRAEAWMNAAASTAQSVSDQSFLQGLNGVMSAINNPERSMNQFAKSTAGSVVPNFIRSLASASDSKQRDTKTPVDALKGAVPGIRQTLPERLDMFGEPLDSKDNFGNMYLNPLNPSKAKDGGPLVKELRRLKDADNGIVTTTFAKNSIGGVELNDEQVRNLNELVNTEVGERWGKLINQDQYKAMTDEDKATALKKVKDAVANNVKAQFVKDNMLNATTEYKEKSIPEVPNVSGGSGVTISSSLKGDSKSTLERFSSMSAEEREDVFYKENDAEYKYNLAKYENDKASGKLSAAEEVRVKKSLRKGKVGKDYSKDTRSLYELSKTDIAQWLSTEEEGIDKKKFADDLLKYDRALYDAGVISTMKFRYGFGNARGRSGGRRGSGLAQARAAISLQQQMNKIGVPKTASQSAPSSLPQYKKVALKKYQVKDAKISKKPIKITTSKA